MSISQPKYSERTPPLLKGELHGYDPPPMRKAQYELITHMKWRRAQLSSADQAAASMKFEMKQLYRVDGLAVGFALFKLWT